ncbi:hypothetical protein HOY82DRAFT_476412 [Tuber indicum]|nr:hypothetical protein HOY82DRAFT_476412 [Tuber indicum]
MYSLPQLQWPSGSLDLNPIEDDWHQITEQISYLPTQPSTKEAMEDAIWTIWVQIGMLEIQVMVDSMPSRVQAVLTAQGGHTRF